MSSYMNFYIMGDNINRPIACGSYSRNSECYDIFNAYAKYAEGTKLTSEILESVRKEIKNREIENEKNIRLLEENKKLIASFNNTVDEKMELIDDIDHDLEMYNDGNDVLNAVAQYTYFLEDMLSPYMNEDIEIVYGIEYYPEEYDID